MSMGPVEMIVVEFPGNRFNGEIIPEVKNLVESGVIRLIDIVLIQKGADGKVAVTEINDLDDADFETFDPIIKDVTGVLADDDIAEVSEALDPDSSAGIMVFEHRWAERLSNAIRRADGELVMSERFPAEVVEEVLAARPKQAV